MPYRPVGHASHSCLLITWYIQSIWSADSLKQLRATDPLSSLYNYFVLILYNLCEMKFPANADIEEYKKSLLGGALKGAGVGVLVGLSAAAILKRRTSFFHGAGGFQKVLVYAAPAAFCTIVNMELTSRSFEIHMRSKQHGTIAPDEPHRDASLWDRLALWGKEMKYPIIVTSWAASLAGSYYLVSKDKFLTRAQKIVQARVYAQGLTVAMLLATVFLSVADTSKVTDKMRAEEQSKSWERDLEYVENANHPHGENASEKDKHAYSEETKELVKSRQVAVANATEGKKSGSSESRGNRGPTGPVDQEHSSPVPSEQSTSKPARDEIHKAKLASTVGTTKQDT